MSETRKAASTMPQPTMRPCGGNHSHSPIDEMAMNSATTPKRRPQTRPQTFPQEREAGAFDSRSKRLGRSALAGNATFWGRQTRRFVHAGLRVAGPAGA